MLLTNVDNMWCNLCTQSKFVRNIWGDHAFSATDREAVRTDCNLILVTGLQGVKHQLARQWLGSEYVQTQILLGKQFAT